jgi:hypothetical protein
MDTNKLEATNCLKEAIVLAMKFSPPFAMTIQGQCQL